MAEPQLWIAGLADTGRVCGRNPLLTTDFSEQRRRPANRSVTAKINFRNHNRTSMRGVTTDSEVSVGWRKRRNAADLKDYEGRLKPKRSFDGRFETERR